MFLDVLCNGKVRGVLLSLIILFSSGCSTILSGRTQTLTVTTTPPGAKCEFLREGRIIGSVSPTPGALTVERTKHDLTLQCGMNGYQSTTQVVESGTEGATFGNILAGGVIGWGVDSATGADNKYVENVAVTLIPEEVKKQ